MVKQEILLVSTCLNFCKQALRKEVNGYWKNCQEFPHITDFFHLKKTGSCSSRDILSLLGYTQMHILKYIYPINTEEE